MAYSVPANVIESSVLTIIAGAADAALAHGHLSITGMSPIAYADILSYVRTAYSTGQNQISTTSTASATVVAGVEQSLHIKRTNGGADINVSVMPTTTSTSDLATLFRAAINGSTTDIVASGAGNNVVLTEQNLTGGFIVYSSDAGITTTYTGGGNQVHIDSTGTNAEVAAYDPTATPSATGFSKYVMQTAIKVAESQGQGTVMRIGNYVLWADESAANYAALNTQMDGVFDTTAILDPTNTGTLAAGIAQYLAK